MRRLLSFGVCSLFLILAGCSESSPTAAKKEPVKPAEAVGGQSALFKMYQVARSAWSLDAQVLKLNSIHLPEVPPTPGKAGAWQATFTSEKLGRSRTYTYSVVESQGNLHKEVFGGPEESWSGKAGINTAFSFLAVKTESDAAYRTALEKAGDYDKKNPGMTITVLLDKTPKFPDPAWRIVWGESVGTSNFSVYVDATSGGFLEKMH